MRQDGEKTAAEHECPVACRWISTMHTAMAKYHTVFTALLIGSVAGCAEPPTSSAGDESSRAAIPLVFCGATIPEWVAVTFDGTRWQRLSARADSSYLVPLAARVGVATFAGSGKLNSYLDVFYGDRSDITAWVTAQCDRRRDDLQGSVLGLSATSRAIVSVERGQSTAFGPSTFALPRPTTSAQTLMAFRFPAGSDRADRGILRRNQELRTAATLSPLDFASAESFALGPVQQVALRGRGASEEASLSISFVAGATSSRIGSAMFTSTDVVAWYPVPPANRLTSDLHLLRVSTLGRSSSTEWFGRSSSVSVASTENVQIQLGPVLSAPQVAQSRGASGVPVLTATFARQTDYGSRWVASWEQRGPATVRAFYVEATSGWINAPTPLITLATPDLTGTTGWQSGWGVFAGTEASWTVGAYSETRGANRSGRLMP